MDINWLDIQHRGFSAYQELTQGKGLNLQGSEQIETVLSDCAVDTDWIGQIEQALPYIENAVHQNRQFILRQGETVPLEKARRVSRESVEHLAKHSELISEDALHPERIYISENVDTYSIYENRFLYLLLRQLEDFVGTRYQKITALAASFSSDIQFTRQLNEGNRKIQFQLTYSETAQGTVSEETEAALVRIRTILQTVELLLRTDLMKEVAAAPLLKPPIARTNVLLHDPNFHVALELYTFLTEYTNQGYKALEIFRKGSNSELCENLSDLVSLTSYLSYRNGMGQELEERRKEAIRAENRKKLEALRAKLGDVSPEALAYIQGLEQQLDVLEHKAQQLEQEVALRTAAESKLASARGQIQALQTDRAKLNSVLQTKNQEIQILTQQNAEIQGTVELRLRHAEHQQDTLRQSYEDKLETQRQEFQREFEGLEEKCRLADALSRDLSKDQGCSKEEFGALEQEFQAFRRYYERQWRRTKKQIRKDQLWKK